MLPPAKVDSDSDLILVTRSDATPVTFGAKRVPFAMAVRSARTGQPYGPAREGGVMTRFIVATSLLSVLSALSLSTAAEDKAVEVTFKSGNTKQCDGVSYMSSDFPGLNFDVYHKFMAREKGVLDRHSWEEIPVATIREVVVAECERAGNVCCHDLSALSKIVFLH
jgi:hypothetical protein